MLLAVLVGLGAACNVDDAEIPNGPCTGGICVGGDAGTNNNNNDPCANITCNQPPTQCHAAVGTCSAGVCDYALMPGQSCQDGNACTSNDMCDATGACVGTAVACTTPPDPTCADGDTSVVYDAQGVCIPGSGDCQYTQQTVSCPGMCGSANPGLCPNPCANRTCDTPPTGCFAVPGACNDLTGACTYTVDPAITMCSDGDPCTNNDACQGDGTCLGATLQCNTPPAATCTGNILRTFTANGAACNAGTSMCDYPFTDTDCGAAGCSNGACNNACDESGCSAWALPANPNGTAVRTCQDANCPTTINLPGLDRNYFDCNVQPIFDATCAYMGCHTTDTPNRRLQIFSVGLKRMAPLLSGTDHDGPLNPSFCNGSFPQAEANCAGRDPLLAAEGTFNFDNARLFSLDAASADQNELLTQPLAGDPQGHVHDSLDFFASTNDVRYQAIRSWLNGQTAGGGCRTSINIPTKPNYTVNTLNYGDGQCPTCKPAGGTCPGSTPATATPPCNPTDCVQ
ncbi:MAG: hypothetical protein KC933_02095 [Myxococcales bacterium]|nr:hypothetical protein [Myxococcales bacterium]